MSKFNLILADPSWKYRDKGHAGKRGAEYKYKTMTDEEIINLPVKELAAEQAALFLWITMPRLPIAFKVMEAWGFKFKTNAFTFVKQNKKSDGFFMGGGSYTRANPELCLLGIKGKPLPRYSKGVRQLVVSHLGKHSEKPAEIRDRIVELFGDLPRIELFSRQEVPGWTAVGNAIDGLDIRDALAKIINSPL